MKQVNAPKIPIFIALISLIISLTFGVQNYLFVKSAVKTEARVKSIDKAKRWITPAFEYSVRGKNYEFEGSSTSPGEYEIGDKEIIYYDPANPENMKLGTFMELWFIPVFCGGFFVILFSVGCTLKLNKKT